MVQFNCHCIASTVANGVALLRMSCYYEGGFKRAEKSWFILVSHCVPMLHDLTWATQNGPGGLHSSCRITKFLVPTKVTFNLSSNPYSK